MPRSRAASSSSSGPPSPELGLTIRSPPIGSTYLGCPDVEDGPNGSCHRPVACRSSVHGSRHPPPDRQPPDRDVGRGLVGARRARARGLPREAPRIPLVPRRRRSTLRLVPPPGWSCAPVSAGLARETRAVGAEFKPSYLVRGLPGHPLHPPLTDATIGAYSFATVAAILSKLGVAEHAFAQAWWLALIVALVSTVLTALAGFADWLAIEWGSELWKTATAHALANVTA